MHSHGPQIQRCKWWTAMGVSLKHVIEIGFFLLCLLRDFFFSFCCRFGWLVYISYNRFRLIFNLPVFALNNIRFMYIILYWSHFIHFYCLFSMVLAKYPKKIVHWNVVNEGGVWERIKSLKNISCFKLRLLAEYFHTFFLLFFYYL